MRTPWTVISIVTIYLYFVNGFGKRWMKNREPFDLTKIINVYNLVQVALNFTMIVVVSTKGNRKIGIMKKCELF
jgi:hypothetical protein